MILSRRQFGKIAALSLLAGPLAARGSLSFAGNPAGKALHGLSAFGELALPENYDRFAWVNPSAPKGGTFSFRVPNWAFNQNPQTFDSLNSFILKGAAPPRMELCFDSLMIADLSDPSALYGRLAQSVEISPDRNVYTFTIRDEARWHDGTRLDAHDIAFTLNLFKEKAHPDIALNLTNLVEAKVLSRERVAVIFDGKQSDRAILTLAVLPIVSKAFYARHDFEKSDLIAPLGSGPYRVRSFEAGAFINYERVPDYWGRTFGFAKGRANFDVLRLDFFLDEKAGFEAFKKGDIKFREEFISKTWAGEYDFPAAVDGRVKRRLFDQEKIPTHQGWAFNLRREKFAHPLTRQAIGLCFDFEWTNKNLFYGAYKRSDSFFELSDFAASGAPDEAEAAVLRSVNLTALAEDSPIFGEAIVSPRSDGSGRDRKLLGKAHKFLEQAGWTQKDSKWVDSKGAALAFEFLIRHPTFERVLGPFIDNLRLIGIDARIRLADASQFQERLDSYDFDITGIARSYGATPTAETLKQIFGSKAADIKGGRNIAGIRDGAVDALLDRMGAVETRAELVTIMRALDRVLRATHSWIQNWHSPHHRIAYWDLFSFPPEKPDYGFQFELDWWFDAEKAAKMEEG